MHYDKIMKHTYIKNNILLFIIIQTNLFAQNNEDRERIRSKTNIDALKMNTNQNSLNLYNA